jgi:hypothetical protein
MRLKGCRATLERVLELTQLGGLGNRIHVLSGTLQREAARDGPWRAKARFACFRALRLARAESATASHCPSSSAKVTAAGRTLAVTRASARSEAAAA